MRPLHLEEAVHKILSLLLMLLLAAATPALAADGSAKETSSARLNRIEQLTGSVWQNSSREGKLGVLFGIELAISVDKATADHMARLQTQKKDKRTVLPYRVSPFGKAWYEAFRDVPLPDIADQIDAWYAAHPDQANRLVLDVIWREIMKRPLPSK